MQDTTSEEAKAEAENAEKLRQHVKRVLESVGKRVLFRLAERAPSIIMGQCMSWSSIHEGYILEITSDENFVRATVGGSTLGGSWYSVMELNVEHVFPSSPTG